MKREDQTPASNLLIRRLDEAVGRGEPAAVCERIKRVLADIIAGNHNFLPSGFLEPTPGSYARRLLYKDPRDRYSAVVMVWDKNQGTPLHDHAKNWCVECVYSGKIRVKSYDYKGRGEGGIHHFSLQTEVVAGVGEAGALIPPFEYHTIENPLDSKAITLHVYKGELTYCHAFYPVKGGYRQERKELTYTN